MAEGIGALLSCRVLNERTAPNRAVWKPDDDAENTAANVEALGGASRTAFTAPGFRRPRQRHSGSGQAAGRSPAQQSRTR